jgi:hypothetical protein
VNKWISYTKAQEAYLFCSTQEADACNVEVPRSEFKETESFIEDFAYQAGKQPSRRQNRPTLGTTHGWYNEFMLWLQLVCGTGESLRFILIHQLNVQPNVIKKEIPLRKDFTAKEDINYVQFPSFDTSHLSMKRVKIFLGASSSDNESILKESIFVLPITSSLTSPCIPTFQLYFYLYSICHYYCNCALVWNFTTRWILHLQSLPGEIDM